MIKIKNILTAIVAAVFAGAMSGCSDDSFSNIQEEPQAVPQLSVTIAASGSSRSGTDGFEEGEGLENYLDITNIHSYRIYFFNSDNTYFDTFTPFNSNIDEESQSENVKYYHFWGAAPSGLPEKFKIVALFNWPEYPVEDSGIGTSSGAFVLHKGVTTINELCTSTFAQFSALTYPGEQGEWLDRDMKRLIPFYGVREYDIKDYVDADDLNDKGEIKGGIRIDLCKKKNGDKAISSLPILRAMAKVEVILDDANLNFESVELVNVNPKGFCAPRNATTHDSYDHGYDWNKDFIRFVHLPWKDDSDKDVNASTTEIIGSLLMTRKSAAEKKWIAYIPEYLNNNVAKDTDCKIKVTLSKGNLSDDEWNKVKPEKKSQYIYFSPDGKQGNPDTYDIWRNNIYRFTISSMSFKMDVSAEIQPFAEQKLTFGFGLMRDSRGDLMVIKIPERDTQGEVKVDEKGDTIYTYPKYFLDFVQKHGFPKEVQVDQDGNILKDEGGNILYKTTEVMPTAKGDYYAIVVGEYESLSEADVWVKDKDGCHVLTNFGKTVDNSNNSADHEGCNSRLVEVFFGNNQSEIFYKDKFDYRRVHHFDNHNSIVRHPVDENLLFCVIDNFGTADETRKYYEVESWDGETGWIIVYDENGNETGDFRQITSDGKLGKLYSEMHSTDQ